jgi:hypothetical protein
MRPVYKFVNEKYMTSLFAKGDVRLGTLHNFRNTELHGANRGDAVEGKNTVHLEVKHHVGPAGGFLQRMLGLGEGCEVENVLLTETRDWPDAYVFCASTIYSEAAFRRWNAEEGVDACYEIFDPVGFARAISLLLLSRATCNGFAPVDYVLGDIDGASELHATPAPWIKPLEYAWQTEFRWVWTLRAPAISLAPCNFVIPNPRRFCRPVARLQSGTIHYISNKIP